MRMRPAIAVSLALVIVCPGLALGQELEFANIYITTTDGLCLAGGTDVACFKIESTEGTVEVKLQDMSRITFKEGTATVVRQDRSTVCGKVLLDSWNIKTKIGEMMIKTADIANMGLTSFATKKTLATQPAQPSQPGTANSNTEGQPPKKLWLTLIKPVKSVGLRCVISGLCLTPDGKKLCALNVSDSQFLIIDVVSFKTDKEIPLSGGEQCMSLSPDGKSAFAVCKNRISQISLAEGKTVKSFKVEEDMSDVLALDDKTLLASFARGVLMISVPKEGVTQTVLDHRGFLRASPSRRRIYTAYGAFSFLDKRSADNLTYTSYPCEQTAYLQISPDEKFAVSTSGGLYRIGKCPSALMVEFARLEPNLTTAFFSSGKRIVVATIEAPLKEYSGETFEPVGFYSLGFKAYDIVPDDAREALYVFGGKGESSSGSAYAPPRASVLGDIHMFELPK